MGCDVAEHSAPARAVFERGGRGARLRFARVATRGPGREAARDRSSVSPRSLRRTSRSTRRRRRTRSRSSRAGHSFAELCSLAAADSLSFEDALRIVSERGKAMQAAAQRARGGMSAILGLDADASARSLEERARMRLVAANFNSPTQIVISGELRRRARCRSSHARRGRKTRRSAQRFGCVAQPADGAGRRALRAPQSKRADLRCPQFDVISNVDGRPYRDVATIKANLIRSVVDEVRWHDAA